MTKTFSCGFCGKEFRSESTLSAHMCPKKRRNLDRDTVASRMGLELFRRFFELNTSGKKPKTFEEFIDSRYYTAFIKLARHLMDLRPIEQDRFIDYLFTNGIKEKSWVRDSVYEKYVIELLTKENPQRALERSIEYMEEWARENNSVYTNFFAEVSTSEATHLIRYGKISPWVLYLAETADALWDRMSPEQAEIIGGVIDSKVWRKKFETKLEHRKFVKEILDEAGL